MSDENEGCGGLGLLQARARVYLVPASPGNKDMWRRGVRDTLREPIDRVPDTFSCDEDSITELFVASDETIIL